MAVAESGLAGQERLLGTPLREQRTCTVLCTAMKHALRNIVEIYRDARGLGLEFEIWLIRVQAAVIDVTRPSKVFPFTVHQVCFSPSWKQ